MIQSGILFTVTVAILKNKYFCQEYLTEYIADIVTNS